MDSALANFLTPPTVSVGLGGGPIPSAEGAGREPLTSQIARQREDIEAMRKRLGILENAMAELLKHLVQQVGLSV